MADTRAFSNTSGTAIEAISQLMVKHRSILSGPMAIDSFLAKIGRETVSHQFLANSTQAVYGRQIAFLTALLRDYKHVPASQIKILDWGCGKGHITYLLQKRGFDVISCDIVTDKDDSSFGQEIPIIDAKGIHVVPLEHPSELPFDDHSFDCVVSFGVLEHVESDMASLREIRRILKPGGVLFITFLPYFLSWTQAVAHLRGNDYHDRLYRQKSFRSLAADSGFGVAGFSHSQLLPKNSMPIASDRILEPIDRALCRYSVFKYLATNLEAVLVSV
jgi:SAM-dependent methyltransferase